MRKLGADPGGGLDGQAADADVRTKGPPQDLRSKT